MRNLGLGDGPVERAIWLRVTDTFGATDTQSALIRVNNVAPTAHPEAYAVDEDNTLRVPPRGVLTNDTDPGADTLTAVRVNGSGTSHGTLVLDLTDRSRTPGSELVRDRRVPVPSIRRM